METIMRFGVPESGQYSSHSQILVALVLAAIVRGEPGERRRGSAPALSQWAARRQSWRPKGLPR